MDNKKFLVYKSSAGSGKTFTLVREYLLLALAAPHRFRNILAITFTNKAAGEMKERIVRSLKSFRDTPIEEMDGTTKELLRQIQKEMGFPYEEIRKRSEQVLYNIIHHYSDFAVSTIDSFVHRLVRSFAFDLNLPLEFDVELDDSKLLGSVIEKLLTRVGSDHDLTEILVSFIESRAEKEGGWKIERDLEKASRALLWEDSSTYLKSLRKLAPADYRKIVRDLNVQIAVFETKMEELGAEAIKIIEGKNIPLDAFFQGAKGIGTYFRKVRENTFIATDPNSYAVKTVDEGHWYAKKADQGTIAAIEEIKGDLTRIYREISEYRDANESRYRLLRLLSKNIYQVATLTEIEKVIDSFRNEDHIIHISEFNKRIASVVLSEPVPFIYERTGEKFDHFLIDEFQDTSILQWQNLIPLLENGLSAGKMSMVVGDTKQAIYRFRSGEVEQFARLPEMTGGVSDISVDRQRVLKDHYAPENLKVNFRSNRDIVEFNNDFFKVIRDELDEKSKVYFEDVYQEVFKDEEGYVRIEFLDADKEEYRSVTVDKVLDEVISLQNGQGYKLSDIAILCRSNKNASFTARHLLSNGIPVISSESLLLYSSPEVNFLVSWLKYLRKPSRGIPMANILNYLARNDKIDEKDMHRLFRMSGKTGTDQSQKLTEYLEGYGYKISGPILQQTGLYDLVEELMRIFGLNSKVNPYLLFFMDTILEQASKGTEDLNSFLDWLEDNLNSLSVVVPENINAVRVMTIHKSKGLQFPVVILPFTDVALKHTRKEIWSELLKGELPPLTAGLLPIEKELQFTDYAPIYETEHTKSGIDLLNLLYVAFTRASERLYVCCKTPGKSQGPLSSMNAMIRHYLKRKDIWKEGKLLYEFGIPLIRVPEKRVQNSLEENHLKSVISENWKERLLLSYNAPAIWDAGNPGAKVNWGNVIHYALSSMTGSHDKERVLEQMLVSGIIDGKEKEEIDNQITAMFNNEKIAKLFNNDWQALTERELIDAKGKSYRPDRILRKDGFVKIIDFKTGKRQASHEDQVKQYAGILEKAGYKVSGLFLLYISGEPELVRLN